MLFMIPNTNVSLERLLTLSARGSTLESESDVYRRHSTSDSDSKIDPRAEKNQIFIRTVDP